MDADESGLRRAVRSFPLVTVEPLTPSPAPRRYTKTRHLERPIEERIPVHGAVPALVSEELWDAVQAMRERNRARSSRNTKQEYLLTGHIVCGRCRRRYGATVTRGHTYYYCPGAKITARAERCRNARLNAKQVAADVCARVLRALSDRSIIADELERRRSAAGSETGAEQDLKLVDAALASLAERERRLVRLYTYAEIDDEVISRETRKLKAERDRLDGERAGLLARLARRAAGLAELEGAARYVERVRARLTSLDFAGRRLALEALGVRVVVDGADYRVEALIPTGDDVGIALPRWSAC